ncbi:MAG: hypothetical protein K6G33_02450 [Ruminococcus sp.]|uniref:hypothetical protein n=1 Tax=Ruminococcus sp. TaxID=41978 RepID=UPI0025DFA178|nr:hypothetical protein [Ruminococcus sp.]MCR5599589.1 hypothetical protein [Ruminococcus sp.]
MKKRKKKIGLLILLFSSISALLFFIAVLMERYNELWFTFTPLLMIPFFLLINIAEEKLADKKSESKALKRASEPESVIRQQILENYEKNAFREITGENMKSDLKTISRWKFAPRWLFMSFSVLIFIPLALWIYKDDHDFISEILLIFTSGIAIFCFVMAIIHFSGFYVKLFIKRADEKLPMIERSYMGGNMICTKECDFNIGIDYCVYINMSETGYFSISDIYNAVLTRKRTKKYDRYSSYGSEKNELYMCISLKNQKHTYDIHGNELQLEYICDELVRRGVKIIKNNLKEK